MIRNVIISISTKRCANFSLIMHVCQSANAIVSFISLLTRFQFREVAFAIARLKFEWNVQKLRLMFENYTLCVFKGFSGIVAAVIFIVQLACSSITECEGYYALIERFYALFVFL